MRPTLTASLLLFLAPALLNATIRWDSTEQEIHLEPGQPEAKVVFGFTNEGDEALVIRDVRASCGCTQVVLERRRIGPGESGTIGTTFSAGRRQGTTRSSLTVFAEGHEKPVGYLRLTAHIPIPVNAKPSIVRWTAGEERAAKTVLLDLDRRYVDHIVDVRSNPAAFTVKLLAPETEGGDPRLEITPAERTTALRDVITVSAKGGAHSSEVRIYAFAPGENVPTGGSVRVIPQPARPAAPPAP